MQGLKSIAIGFSLKIVNLANDKRFQVYNNLLENRHLCDGKNLYIKYYIIMEKLIEIRNLKKYFSKNKGLFSRNEKLIYTLNGINLDIYQNETLGLVGESGCGKTTLGRVLLNLTQATSGSIKFDNTEISNLSSKQLKPFRKNMQMIFQNSYSSLNPRMKIKDILAEPLKINTTLSKEEIKTETEKVLNEVGLSYNIADNFPHEFSGGQRQRIAIAKALILKPKFIVADEPISALDICIQAQIIKLLKDLKEKFNLTYLFISHDLSTVKSFCSRTAVMYLGEIVEIAKTEELFSSPKHPYTKALLNSVLQVDKGSKTKVELIKGELPSNENLPVGCNFASRCPYATQECLKKEPETTEISQTHKVNCFNFQ